MPRLPKDPTWTYPYRTRNQIAAAKRYLAKCHAKKHGWNNFKHRERPEALPGNRPNKIEWESVPPQFRQATQEWFNQKIAECKARGISLTDGKIRSLRCNATRQGRHIMTKKHGIKMWVYYSMRAVVERYEKWLTQQQKIEHQKIIGKTESRVLEVA